MGAGGQFLFSMLAGREYQWRVRAANQVSNDAITSNWSDPFTIKVVGTDAPLYLDPATKTVGVNGIFDVAIKTNVASSQSVSGVDAFINFDPSKLEVVDAEPFSPL